MNKENSKQVKRTLARISCLDKGKLGIHLLSRKSVLFDEIGGARVRECAWRAVRGIARYVLTVILAYIERVRSWSRLDWGK